MSSLDAIPARTPLVGECSLGGKPFAANFLGLIGEPSRTGRSRLCPLVHIDFARIRNGTK